MQDWHVSDQAMLQAAEWEPSLNHLKVSAMASCGKECYKRPAKEQLKRLRPWKLGQPLPMPPPPPEEG